MRNPNQILKHLMGFLANAIEDNEEHFEKIREKLFKEIFTKKYRAWIKHLREHSFIEIRL